MTKLGRLLFVFLLLLCTTQLFADKKKVVEPTLEGEAKVQFDYAFMEGVRCKVLGDLKSAIAYFDQCMKIYNKSAAVRYELSSSIGIRRGLYATFTTDAGGCGIGADKYLV